MSSEVTMGSAAPRPMPSLPIHLAPPTAPAAGPLDAELPSSAALARMVQEIDRIGPTSGAEALRALRRIFPDSPLALRVAALNALLRRHDRGSGYMPR